jgi:opacity protein-like surface antigen
MKATSTIAIAALLTVSAAGAVQAQDQGRFSLELRAGAAIPTADLGPRELQTGVLGELTANFQVLPHLALYAGWDWARLALAEDLGAYNDVEDTGYTFGARFFAPSLGPVTPWLRAGGLYDHIEMEEESDEGSVSADHVLGWEAGAGAAIALGDTWSLLPGVRYRSFSPELVQPLGGEVDVRYVTVDIGISKTFGGRSMAAIRHR